MQVTTPKKGYKLVKTSFGKYEEIPEEWEYDEIKTIGEIVTGSTPSTSIKEYYGNEFSWAGPPDLDKSKFVTDTKFALGMGLSTGVFSYTGLQTETIQKIKEIYT